MNKGMALRESLAQSSALTVILKYVSSSYVFSLTLDPFVPGKKKKKKSFILLFIYSIVISAYGLSPMLDARQGPEPSVSGSSSGPNDHSPSIPVHSSSIWNLHQASPVCLFKF